MSRHFLALLLLVLTSCASLPTPLERRQHAQSLADTRAWAPVTLPGDAFDLVAFMPRQISPAETLTVYIEGDGLAWVTSTQASRDPTPRDPLALRLALADDTGAVAYLARPCQFVDAESRHCTVRYWTDARFAPEVIEASDHAISQIKARFAARHLVLAGYSGGGAVAALVAARRRDVVGLITVAGNLDHRAWTHYQRISPLSGSLNAADFAGILAGLPQTHWIGERDEVIPPELAAQWDPAFLGTGARNLHIVPNADHRCCWAEHWATLRAQP